MEYSDFSQLVAKVQGFSSPKRVAVAGAVDDHSVEAAIHAHKEGIAVPVLVGPKEAVRARLEALKASGSWEIVDSGDENPGAVAVELVKKGKADFLMKGKIETKDLLKPLVAKENGLNTGRVMTAVALAEIPNYHKLIMLVDGGMIIYPDLEQKKQIILSASEIFHKLGYENPKVACLCGVEVVNPKMTETVDAAKLVEMNKSGEIPGCTVIGPISYDLIMSREAAAIKSYDCPYCQDFDVILVPALHTGNALTKSWVYQGGAKWAGIIAGAKVPVVLVSRGSSAEEKFLSLVLAAVTSQQ